MKLNTIARTIAAVLLALGAFVTVAGAVSADDNGEFTPPYSIEP